jgi:probable HAF family extracellular repeat protein
VPALAAAERPEKAGPPGKAHLLPQYTYVTLDPPGTSFTFAAGVNNKGEVVGYYIDAAQNAHGFLYSGGTYTTLDVPGASGTLANGINDSGQIVGCYGVAGPPDEYGRPTGTTHGFLFTRGSYATIDPPGSTDTQAYGINNAGQIVGVYGQYDLGFLLSQGTYTTLYPPGATNANTSAYGISNSGQIVGNYYSSVDQESHGYVLNAGNYTILPIPPMSGRYGRNVVPLGINDSGRIVGVRNIGAFVFYNGTYEMLPVNSASGINDAGQIVGNYFDKKELSHGYIATPTVGIVRP